MLAPERVDQEVRSDDLVRLENEERKHGPPLGAAHFDRTAVSPNFEWTEHPKLEHVLTVTPLQTSENLMKAP